MNFDKPTEALPGEDRSLQDALNIIKKTLTGGLGLEHGEGLEGEDKKRYLELKNLAEIQLITEGYEKSSDGPWKKSEVQGDVPEKRPEYTSLKDHEDIIRARLTGGEFPASAKGKMESPMWVGSEETYTTNNIIRQLTKEGYKEEDGIWRRPEHLIN
jgi:hypothetical protein